MRTLYLQDAVPKQSPRTSPKPTSLRVTRMHSRGRPRSRPLAILYALPTAPFTKMANRPFKWGLQHRFGVAASRAGHLCGKQVLGSRARQRWSLLSDMLCSAHGVPRKLATTDSEIFWMSVSKLREPLLPLSRPCHYQEIANQQHKKPVLFARPTHTIPNQWHGHLSRCKNWHGQT